MTNKEKVLTMLNIGGKRDLLVSRTHIIPGLLLIGCLLVSACNGVQGMPNLSDVFPSLSRGGPLSESTIAAGIKEALRVGAERAVESTSRPGGFLKNAVLHIGMPQELATMATALRTVGLGHHVDTLEVAMNEAAEKASGEAKAVLWETVSAMTLTDAVSILKGHNRAATDYFRERTADSLKARFRPIVDENMNKVGLSRQYRTLVQAYQKIPFTSVQPFDLNNYVTEKGLQGLFTILGKEEEKIRKDPLARSSQLLKQVFGTQDGTS